MRNIPDDLQQHRSPRRRRTSWTSQYDRHSYNQSSDESGTNKATDGKLTQLGIVEVQGGQGNQSCLISSIILPGSLMAVPLAVSNNRSLAPQNSLSRPASAPFDHL